VVYYFFTSGSYSSTTIAPRPIPVDTSLDIPHKSIQDELLGSTANEKNKLPPAARPGPRMNATFVTLARNMDVWEIAKSIRHVEDRFNRKFNYDWVFLNDVEFDDTFKRVTTAMVSGTTKYGIIPKEHWSFPDWIDQDKAAAVREDMRQRKIIYGDSISYRHMCRYESGFFFRHPLLLDYEWYWRVEPSIELFCDIEYDTFKYMADNNKKYSFVLSLYEYVETIPTLWDTVKEFTKKHPEHVAPDNSIKFISDDGGKEYNHCHFVGFYSDKMHANNDSGQTLKLATSIGFDPKPTWTTLSTSTSLAASFTKDGEMRQYTA
jgi:alpha 1,2-mannosyltransferase